MSDSIPCEYCQMAKCICGEDIDRDTHNCYRTWHKIEGVFVAVCPDPRCGDVAIDFGNGKVVVVQGQEFGTIRHEDIKHE